MSSASPPPSRASAAASSTASSPRVPDSKTTSTRATNVASAPLEHCRRDGHASAHGIRRTRPDLDEPRIMLQRVEPLPAGAFDELEPQRVGREPPRGHKRHALPRPERRQHRLERALDREPTEPAKRIAPVDDVAVRNGSKRRAKAPNV